MTALWQRWRALRGGTLALLMLGSAVLVLDQGFVQGGGSTQVWGLLAVLAATAAWGVDNTLSRALAERDPGQVVMGKALLGVTGTALMATGLGEPGPTWGAAIGLLLVGATGYGLRAQPEAVSAGAAGFRRRTHGLGVCLRALHRRCDRHRAGRALRRLADAAGWPAGAQCHRHRHDPVQHAHPHVPDVHHLHRH